MKKLQVGKRHKFRKELDRIRVKIQAAGHSSSSYFSIESETVERSGCRRHRTVPLLSAARERERVEGESTPKTALVRVFSRDPIRGGLTNRGKPCYSSSRRCRYSLYPIPFHFLEIIRHLPRITILVINICRQDVHRITFAKI